MTRKTDTYFSNTLDKGLKILSLFNQDRVRCSLADLSRLSGINKTSTYRYVNTFVELGYLRREPETRLLKLGTRAVAMAHGFLRGFDLVQMIRPIVDAFHEKYRLTVDTALADGNMLLILYRREAGNTLTYRLPTVSRSLHCSALGKAILAYRSPEDVEAFIQQKPLERKTANTITDKDKLLEELALIRSRGYSINNEEYIPGLIAIGAPLIDVYTKKVIGSICFDMNTFQVSVAEMEEKYADAVISLADQISEVIPVGC